MSDPRRLALRARVATLLDHFKLTPAQIGRLTDRQINQLYFHARDEQTGAVKAPPPPPRTPRQEYQAEMATLDGLLAAHLISRANRDECAARLRAKFGIEDTASG